MDYNYSTIAELAALIEEGEISPLELTQGMLSRIDALNPDVSAYLHIAREDALAAAALAEQEIQAGQYRGPLHGVPLAVKDLLSVAGQPWTCGSKVLSGRTAENDATVVARLKASGAVLLGKLNMTEFALSGYHPELPVAVNPWAADRWSGVSSSGSAVATAMGLAYATLGTDTGGSIRFPCAVNGVVGLKPTFGLVSKQGALPLAETLDHVGPITRCVEDAAIMLDAIAGFDAEDTYSLPGSYQGVRDSIADGAADFSIGIDQSYVEKAHPEVAAAVLAAAQVLSDLGVVVKSIDISAALDCCNYWGAVVAAEARLTHGAWYPAQADDYGPVFRATLEAADSVRGVDYAAAQFAAARARSAFNRAFQQVDAVLCPGAPLPAMPLAEFPPSAVLPAEMVADFVTFTAPMNFSGHPTLSLPCGFSSEGLPLGLQLVGPHLSEASLLRLGRAYEIATDWHRKTPPAAD